MHIVSAGTYGRYMTSAPSTEPDALGALTAPNSPNNESVGSPMETGPFGSELSLAEVTFVVVDLETTGGVPANCGITEIGAVKVRMGEVQSDFRTFCNPGLPIPAFITELTGISNAHVESAPTTDIAVQDFLNWAQLSSDHTTVLVAHNATFDIGFLLHACAQHSINWPQPPVLDTLRLARKVLSREEVPDKKLSTLAAHFNAPTTPNHRALDDAMATVTVLHALLERAAGFGVLDPVTLLGYKWSTPK